MTKYKLPGMQASVKNVHNALSCWHDLSGKDGSLLCELLLVQERRKDSANKNIVALRKITNQILEEGIGILREQDEECALILRKRFKENKTIIAVSLDMNLSQDQLNRKQRDAIELLTEILLSREHRIREEKSSYQISRLESHVSETIFGNKEVIKVVCDKLLGFGDPEIIVIAGLGGIGKTTVANAVAKNAIAKFRFDDLLWIRSNQDELWPNNNGFSPESFLQLIAIGLGLDNSKNDDLIINVKKELTRKPYLVVVDNLSSEDDVDSLIEFVKGFANPSKFLITSRRKPSVPNNFFTVSVSELDLKSAMELVLDQAQRVGLEQISTEIEQSFELIYSYIGGNPLALKLFIGLLDVLPLSSVLEEFRDARLDDVEEMYKYIYWQAWNMLSEPARSLLVGMVQVSEDGVTLENMQAWSGLSGQVITSAIKELFVRSLMEWRGTIDDRRYGVHQLTMTFLQTDIVRWPPE